MPRYVVDILITCGRTYYVDADTPQQALELAKAGKGSFEDFTIDPDEQWDNPIVALEEEALEDD